MPGSIRINHYFSKLIVLIQANLHNHLHNEQLYIKENLIRCHFLQQRSVAFYTCIFPIISSCCSRLTLYIALLCLPFFFKISKSKHMNGYEQLQFYDHQVDRSCSTDFPSQKNGLLKFYNHQQL